MFPFLRFLSPKTKNNNWYLEPFSYWTCRMEGESSFSQVALPVFDGEGYDPWTVRMESCLEGLDLWKAVEDYIRYLKTPP